MAFFDLLSPFFLALDGFFTPFTSTLFRIIFWAIISALVTSLVFKKLSNPEKITDLKTELKSKQKELNDHDGEFSELKGLAVDTMKLSIKRMGLTFFPAMMASIPIVFILAYLSNNYDLSEPTSGEVVPINVVWEDQNNPPGISIEKNNETISLGDVHSIVWPQSGEIIKLVEANNNFIAFPLPVSSVVHKKQWWNALIGNPAGYLNDKSALNRIEFTFQKQKIIDFGPGWMQGWLFVFFFMTFAFSIVFLFIFKIKF